MRRISLSDVGNDSRSPLDVVRLNPRHSEEVMGNLPRVGLLTTINDAHDRVAMHGVRRELLQAQAERVGLPSP